jgi:elongation factor Ts
MAQITAADVKKLREMSGAGMMDCKKALTETDGDLDAAVDFLRKKGLSAASKKAGRIAAEGVVIAKSEGNTAVVVEINAETDFVFEGDLTVEQVLSQLIATIGENMSIRRFELIEVDSGVTAAYVHGAGKIGVLVGIKGEASDALNEFSRGVAMHVAAVSPRFISRDDVSEEAIERERSVLTERAAASGKPEAIIDKIVTGQMGKFYSEVCLLEQDFVMDSDLKVGKALENIQADAEIISIARFQLGEGIEKREEDFAAEVAAQVNG